MQEEVIRIAIFFKFTLFITRFVVLDMRLEMLVFRVVLLVSWFDYVNAGRTSEMRVTWEVCTQHSGKNILNMVFKMIHMKQPVLNACLASLLYFGCTVLCIYNIVYSYGSIKSLGI